MKVQVTYAESDRMLNCWVEVEGQATVADCLLRAAVSEEFVTLDIRQFDVGIFGERCEPERVVRDKDRIELYRPLHNDAKTARRLRAKQQTTAN